MMTGYRRSSAIISSRSRLPMRKVKAESFRWISFTTRMAAGSSRIALHRRVQTVTLELMHKMLCLFQTFTHQHAFAGGVDLHHMVFGFRLWPMENLLKNVRHVIHQVHWIVPANDEVTRLKCFF